MSSKTAFLTQVNCDLLPMNIIHNTLCGIPSIAMFCFVLFRMFQLPIGLHSSCSIQPNGRWNMSKMFYKISRLSGRPSVYVYVSRLP